MLTPEQKEAQEALEIAIRAHTEAWKDEEPQSTSEVLVEWVVVMYLTGWDDDGDEVAAYRFAFPNGQLADHKACGLLEYGAHLLKYGRRTE